MEGKNLMHGARDNSSLTMEQIRMLEKYRKSMWRSLRFGLASRRGKVRLLGFDGSSGKKAKVSLPQEYKSIIEDLSRQGNNRFVEEWKLPLDKYNYPL